MADTQNFNPFNNDTLLDETIMKLNMIENHQLRAKFKRTQNDAIVYAFDALKNDTVMNLAVDLVKETLTDFCSFVSYVVRH